MPKPDLGDVCGFGTTACGRPATIKVLVWVKTKDHQDQVVGALLKLCATHRISG